MFSTLKITDAANRWLANSEQSSKVRRRLSFGAKSPHLSHLIVSELGVSALLSNRTQPAIPSISHVFLVSSTLQMIWVHTLAIIAMVHDFMSFGHFNPGEHKGKTVGRINSPVEPKVSVPGLSFGPNPKPATAYKVGIFNRVWNWPIHVSLSDESFPLSVFGFSLLSHKRKTPAASKVKCAGESAIGSNGRRFDLFTILTATSRPTAV